MQNFSDLVQVKHLQTNHISETVRDIAKATINH